MPNNFPEDWREQPCYVVAIPKPLIPFVGGLLKLLEQKGMWNSAAEYEAAYTATVELEGCLMATCLNDLMELQQATYRMLNTSLNGVGYETVSTDPLVIEPAITPFVTTDIYSRQSVNGRLEDLLQMVDNSLNGTETPNYDNPPSVRDKLQEIKEAIEAGSASDEDILEQLVAIAGLLA